MGEGKAVFVVAGIVVFLVTTFVIGVFLLVGKLVTDGKSIEKAELPAGVTTNMVNLQRNDQVIQAASIGFQDGAFWGALAMYQGLIKTNILEEAAYQAAALKARVRMEQIRKEKDAVSKVLTN